ncbi:hypothetical protein OCHUTO_0865 [Orientia chuto str. Dubai]|uniref:Ankyrin repeats family protein n=1 Tax=Orientia chuto str. Dubai TaxID=1359168 RepID=A0A0F3MLB9_9RICK|nr:hypothetical protein [Candidatus Orientia mediorientalis]KJV55394.1 hypothetical protein OCHUTO_0865 [Orientia chuto str. Dubai]
MEQVIGTATGISTGVKNLGKNKSSSTLVNSYHCLNKNASNSGVSTNLIKKTEDKPIQCNSTVQLFKLVESEKSGQMLAALIGSVDNSNINILDEAGEGFVYKIGNNNILNLLDKYHLFYQLKSKGANFEQEDNLGNTVANILLKKYIETSNSKILAYFLYNTDICIPNKAFFLSLMQHLQEADSHKYCEMHLFIKTIENLQEKNISLSTNEVDMALKLLLSYGLSSSCTLHYQNEILYAAKYVMDYYQQALEKNVVNKFIKYMQSNNSISLPVAQFGVSVIQHLSSDGADLQRVILDSLAKKYSYADKSKILQQAIGIADSEALNDLSNGNTFLHVLKKEKVQDYHKLVGYAITYGADISLQNNKGKTIFDNIDLKSYNDQLLIREIILSGCLDKLCAVRNNDGTSFFQKAIKFIAKEQFILPEIKDAILEFNPSQALLYLAEMCNKHKVNLQSTLELVQDLSTKTDSSHFIINCSRNTLKEISKLPYWYVVISSLDRKNYVPSLIKASGKLLYPLSDKETKLNNEALCKHQVTPSVPELDTNAYFSQSQNSITNSNISENELAMLPMAEALGEVSSCTI